MKTLKIIIYDEPTVPEIQIKRIKKFITDTFNVKVELQDSFFKDASDATLEKTAATRIYDLKARFKRHVPSASEINTEMYNTDTSNMQGQTAMYDGHELQDILSKEIPSTQETLYIIITNKLTVTFDEGDFRYHARALISSNPTIISTTGIIKAPARPRQYYLDIMTSFSKEEIKKIEKRYSGEFLEYHDLRLNKVVEGYILQAIVYHETGDPFCKNKKCRLFNAHWQRDLLYSQIENPTMCKRHLKIINKLKNQQGNM